MAMYDPRRKKDREEGPSWKRKKTSKRTKVTVKNTDLSKRSTKKVNLPKITVKNTDLSNRPKTKITAKAKGATPTGGQGGSKSRYSAGGSLKISSSTKQASKKGAVLINGKPPSRIQKRLLAGGWTVKELEAKGKAYRAAQDARKKKK